MKRFNARKLTFTLWLCLLISATAEAGTWGEENWGSMYWGDNPVDVAKAPTFSIAVEGTTLILSIADYAPGDDGWSVVSQYTVTCNSISTTSSSAEVRLEDLDPNTEYTCQVTATNAAGVSNPQVQIAMTESVFRGLPAGVLQLLLDD